jgi:hypothetical protein
MARTATAERTVKFRTFRSYAEHQGRMKERALSSIEESGIAAALERCRVLAQRTPGAKVGCGACELHPVSTGHRR